MEAPADQSVVVVRSILEVEAVSFSIGGLTVLNDVSVNVEQGEICAVIGPNGAGKTSLFNCISGLYRPNRGAIRIAGKDLTSLPTHARARCGLARTFQNMALFESLSVRENVMCGGHHRTRSSLVSEMLSGRSVRAEERAMRSEADDWLGRVGLFDEADRLTGELPFGSQQRVELARALMSRPRVLMLDEPASGLDAAEVDELATLIRRLRHELDLSILLVEHHIGFVVGLSQHVVVMDVGSKIAEGSPAAVTEDPVVVDAYLGDPL